MDFAIRAIIRNCYVTGDAPREPSNKNSLQAPLTALKCRIHGPMTLRGTGRDNTDFGKLADDFRNDLNVRKTTGPRLQRQLALIELILVNQRDISSSLRQSRRMN
jgi:hypothetical protein